MRRPYGFLYNGKTIRKWMTDDGQTNLSEKCPPARRLSETMAGEGEEWYQVFLSAWDYSGHKVTEFEPIKENEQER